MPNSQQRLSLKSSIQENLIADHSISECLSIFPQNHVQPEFGGTGGAGVGGDPLGDGGERGDHLQKGGEGFFGEIGEPAAVPDAGEGAVLERDIEEAAGPEGGGHAAEDIRQIRRRDVEERGAGPDPVELLPRVQFREEHLPHRDAGISRSQGAELRRAVGRGHTEAAAEEGLRIPSRSAAEVQDRSAPREKGEEALLHGGEIHSGGLRCEFPAVFRVIPQGFIHDHLSLQRFFPPERLRMQSDV